MPTLYLTDDELQTLHVILASFIDSVRGSIATAPDDDLMTLLAGVQSLDSKISAPTVE